MSWRSEEDFCCPACHDIFRDPVLLSCSHSFCRSCLQTWWAGKQARACPVCRTESEWSDPPRNLVLRNLCEALLQERHQQETSGGEMLCHLHTEKLKLFCVDHQEPVCLVCRDAKIHKEHRFRPVDEAAQERREELQGCLKALRDKREVFSQVRENCDRMAEHIKVQHRHVERKMREKFEQLHHFLEEEEETRMAALREEEEQKSRAMREKIEALSSAIAALSDAIGATEDQLNADDVSVLKNHQAAEDRAKQLPGDPTPDAGALIEVAKHLGNLTFSIWTSMKDKVSYSPVILDPNTANAELILSEDLTSVRYGKRQHRPENPERFEYWDSVLGTGFTSGMHSWDVEVGDNQDWELGVLAGSVCRREFMGTTAWSVEFNHLGYRVYSPAEKYTNLQLSEKLQTIRVQLDCDRGRLSFYEPRQNTLLHTFAHTSTEKLFPFFCTRKALPLKILPAAVTVTVGGDAGLSRAA